MGTGGDTFGSTAVIFSVGSFELIVKKKKKKKILAPTPKAETAGWRCSERRTDDADV